MALDTFIDTEQTTERTRRIFATEFKTAPGRALPAARHIGGQGGNATSGQCQSAA